jgi:uncharacterized protein (DUF1697 family)
MSTLVLLLRGINLGPRNRISMPELREALAEAGFEDVRTYVQSGNVVLSAEGGPDEVARETERVIARRFGVEVSVLARTRDELAKVIDRNPLAKAAAREPKRCQVTFLSAELDRDAQDAIEAAAAGKEQVVFSGREVYAWHPTGIGRSKLAELLGRKTVGGTARNWSTVTKLLELADE